VNTTSIHRIRLSLVNRPPPPAESIKFAPQLLLVDSPLPTFFCAIDCSVFVSDSSPWAYADVENIPVNAAANKTVPITRVLSITIKYDGDYI
jgi:hypothetical protein